MDGLAIVAGEIDGWELRIGRKPTWGDIEETGECLAKRRKDEDPASKESANQMLYKVPLRRSDGVSQQLISNELKPEQRPEWAWQDRVKAESQKANEKEAAFGA